jgi:hypothetical protein
MAAAKRAAGPIGCTTTLEGSVGKGGCRAEKISEESDANAYTAVSAATTIATTRNLLAEFIGFGPTPLLYSASMLLPWMVSSVRLPVA